VQVINVRLLKFNLIKEPAHTTIVFQTSFIYKDALKTNTVNYQQEIIIQLAATLTLISSIHDQENHVTLISPANLANVRIKSVKVKI